MSVKPASILSAFGRIHDNTGAVLEEAEGYDLTVLGIVTKRHMDNVRKPSFQEKIAHRYRKSPVIVDEAKWIGSITK